jgi:membrane protease YdiL (CAAX protease family)
MIRALIPDHVNAAGLMLLLLTGVLLPILIVRSSRRIGSGPLPISRQRFYRQTILFQLFLAALSVWTAWTNGVVDMPLPRRPLVSWSAAALMYVLTLITLRLRWPGRSAASKRRLYDILPHDTRELVPYIFVCLVAALAEEIIYRGVMTVLLQSIIGIRVVTIVLVSISFAVAHAMQGWRSVAGIFVIALACHALVWIAQSLLPVMVVHFTYDLTAGLLIPRWHREAMPSDART